ncbi:MAG TPA: ATP-binding protein [Bacteroidales bacterium]|nr:ATP-binding protein [Bacteroidales bacterium]
MISKSLYINIIIRVLAIVLLSVLLGYIIFSVRSVRFSVICALVIILIAYGLIKYLNSTNRNIRFFFDSLVDDDSNLSFPVDNKSGIVRELHQSMNSFNHQLQKLKFEIRKQEHYFSRILEHLATGIITYNDKGFIHHANSSAKRLLSTEALTHLRQIERVDRKLYKTIMNFKPQERKLVPINTSQGEVQLLLKSTLSGTKENELTILSIQDIKHELDEKEVDSWMRLIRVLMHEIMNSITPITSLSESLTRIFKNGEEPVQAKEVSDKTISTVLQGLNVIVEQGKSLSAFVESYRKLTRIPRPELKLFKVSELLARVRILSDSLEKGSGTVISFENGDPDLEIFADGNLISLVLINLIKNAFEANENNPGCRIRVISRKGYNLNPEICVCDNGPGISEENLEEIFIPFFTTREKGSGIGLSISKQIMGAHGGSLKVRSIPGKETIFCMSFQD